MAPPLVVDSEALFAVGSAVIAAGGGLTANLTVLTSGFAAHTGVDAAGHLFGQAYQDAAESLLKAMAAAINACGNCGALIQQGASNYSKAEAASTLGGGAGVLQSPPEPVKVTAPGPPGTWGKGEPPPLLWAVVDAFVADAWPDGDVAAIRAAAARWRGFAAGTVGTVTALNSAMVLLDAHQIPEGGKIDVALSQIRDGIAKIGEGSAKLATALDKFAGDVEQAQNAICDLLHRLGSLADLGHDLMLIIKGDALDEIKKIANDINAILHDLGREARAEEQEFKMAMQSGDGLIVKFEKWTRNQLTQFLGEEVGNSVATQLDLFVNIDEGIVKGFLGTVLSLNELNPAWFALDPEGAAATWSDLGKTMWKGSVFNAMIHPQEAAETQLQQVKSLLHLDDWSTARPGLGLGENLFDLALLVVPGGGEAGAAADGAGAVAREGAEAAEAAGKAEGAFGKVAGALEDARGLADIAGTGGDLTKGLEDVSANLPKIEPPLGGRPVELPAPKPLDPPVEPRPHAPGEAGEPHDPANAAPAPGRGPHEPVGEPHEPVGAPHEPARAPVGGPHEPVSVAAPRSPLASAPAAVGEHVPAAVPRLVEYAPAPLPPSLAEPAPVAAHAATPAPSLPAATPHFTAPPARPPDMSPGGGWHPPGDESALGGRPHGKPPHGGDPHAPGDGKPHGSETGPPADDGNGHAHDGDRGETPQETGLVGQYPLPAPDLVTPPPDGAFFWSGRTSDGVGIGPTSAGGNGAADSFAGSHSGTTLEGLLERNGVIPPKWSFDDTAAQEWWSRVSDMYAENVRGEVHAVIGSNLRPGNVWEAVELPRLMSNPDVTKITVIDPETGAEIIIFER